MLIIARLKLDIGRRGGILHLHRPRNIRLDAAESVDEVLEPDERRHGIVVGVYAGEVPHRSDGLLGIGLEKRLVDLRVLPRKLSVARNRHKCDDVVARIDANERENIGMLIDLRVLVGAARVKRRALARVGPDEQHVERILGNRHVNDRIG